MKGRVLLACARKEVLLLWRDPQTLAMLFVMPAVFILIMSLALEDQFETDGDSVATVLVVDRDGSDAAQRLVTGLAEAGFDITRAGGTPGDVSLRERMAARDHDFGLRIGADFARLEQADGHLGPGLQVLVAAHVGHRREALLLAAVRAGLGRARLQTLADELGPLAGFDPSEVVDGGVTVRYQHGDGVHAERPSSVQQNVPAWLVFGMFFVVIPLSNTLIRERQSGMERRLRTTPAGPGAILAGKLLPYCGINLLQALAMLAVGVYLVPLLGGQALSMTAVPASTLALMSIAVSVAALGYALLVASISRTTEQAALLGGGGNIILAAIGGIMVPEFVMPPAVQALTSASPMGWGLHGFLPAFLEHAGPASVLDHAGALLAFGGVGIGLAFRHQCRRSE